jgi:outer membrane biosynthesis protein TonB
VLAASFGLSASTWIALGVLAGFTSTLTVQGLTLFRLAWLMPIAVDGYVVVALVLWMAPVPARVAAFAKKNTYLAAGTGIVAQSAYHLLFTMSTTDQWWRVVLAALVGALPPTVAGLAVHMRALIRRESGNQHAAAPSTLDTAAVPPAAPRPAPAAPSTVDTTPTQPTQPTEPTRPAATPVPTPAVIAARITAPRPTPAAPAAAPDQPARTTRPQPAAAPTPSTRLAPPATDSFVAAQGAAQLALPIAGPQPLNRAREVARQYRAEHGTRITAGQLAARLKVNSDQAAHLLNLLNTEPTTPTVNGNRPAKAAR